MSCIGSPTRSCPLSFTPPPFRTTAIRTVILSFLLLLNRTCATPVCDLPAPHMDDPVRDGLQYINSHFCQSLTLDDIAAHVRVSKYHFLRRFKELTGYTVNTYIRLLRCRRATKLLRTTDARVGDIARACGFDSSSYFTKTFMNMVGMLPGDYRAAEQSRPPHQTAKEEQT